MPDNRSWLKVQPDKEYLIAEERLRFAMPADLPVERIPVAAYLSGELPAAIEIFEKHRGWKRLDVVPKRKRFPGGKPCCVDIMSKPVGSAMTTQWLPSSFQGDTDDAHNFGELSDPGKRLFEENLIDWVCVMHFWVPAINVDLDAEADYRKSLGLAQGFAPVDLLPRELKQILEDKFKDG